MHTRHSTILCFLIAMIFTGCATVNGPKPDNSEIVAVQKEFEAKALLHEIVQMKRLSRIGYDLVWQLPREDILGEGRPFIGLFTTEQNDLTRNLFNTSKDAPRGPFISFVLANTPVAEVGLKPGDIILAINGKTVRSPKDAKAIVTKLEQQTRAQVKVSRRGHELVFPVEVQRLPLNVYFNISRDIKIQAVTTFTEIEVSFGMLNFINNDTELAAVLAHELAHIARLHTRNIPVIVMAGILANKLNKDIERDADYFAIKFLHAGGYDLSKAGGFYERLAIELPETLKGGILYTHPGTAERITRIRKSVAEFQSKRR